MKYSRIAENADYAGLVCEKCGFEPQTREYLDNYKMDAWKGLVQIALRGNVVGLKADGSLIACGYDMDGQCHVGFWEDVVDIYSVSDVTVGVRKDGTLITTGGSTWNISQIDTWTGVLVADK